MKFRAYLKDNILTIVLLLFALVTIEIFLMAYKLDTFIRIYIPVVILAMYFIGLIITYHNKKTFYDKTLNILNELDNKYLISEMISSPGYMEEKLLTEILEQTDKSMLENVNKYRYLQEEYKEYIELWIHEIKLPIATGKMIIANNKSEVAMSIDEELDRIEGYIEQALFYARSNTVEKDYCITRIGLKEIVNTVIKKNKKRLIQEKVKIDINNIDLDVSSDRKWCEFILNQIIQNSIKYPKSDNKIIQLHGEVKKDKVVLYIKDNGIGIRKGEITRVFEKGFTGTNGRMSGKKSTGIGLYLCKKLCNKLGLGIELNSIENVETEVRIIFPQNSYIEM